MAVSAAAGLIALLSAEVASVPRASGDDPCALIVGPARSYCGKADKPEAYRAAVPPAVIGSAVFLMGVVSGAAGLTLAGLASGRGRR